MKYTIHQIIEKLIKVLESFGEDISTDDIDLFNLRNYIQILRVSDYDEEDVFYSLFDLVGYCEEGKMPDERIKVCKKLLWYFNDSFNVQINLDITEEQFFQQSTVKDFANIPYETIINCNKLIEILGKIHDNELRKKAITSYSTR